MTTDSSLQTAAGSIVPVRSSVSGVLTDLLERIREENLNVYRASLQRLREDVGQESQISKDYQGRLVYELLQNADDAMAEGTTSSCIRFELTDDELWVANSGRPLDEADVRGLCGISASKKSMQTQKRRASIGHKGMGFKSVLEITDVPEVFSTTVCFHFSPDEAIKGVQPLVAEERIDRVPKAPITRFPWASDPATLGWDHLQRTGMNTAFRFPLCNKMTEENRNRLAGVLRDLPVTSLVFLKHIGRIEVDIKRSSERRTYAWSVRREYAEGATWGNVTGFTKSGDYRVTLVPDAGATETFLLAYDADISIGNHRGGLDEFTWEGVEFCEVSVAVRIREGRPSTMNDEWRRFHVFLPTGEPCPYNILVSGAFGSNLSRQEIRVEDDATNYNRFLFHQAARVFSERLFPKLLNDGFSVIDCLRLLDRRVEPCTRCATSAGQTFYEAIVASLVSQKILSSEDNEPIAIQNCAVPPIISDDNMGKKFRELLRSDTAVGGRILPRAELCGATIGRVLVDHGAYAISPAEAASLLASADPSRSELTKHKTGKLLVDPVLDVLEQLWRGLSENNRSQLVTAVRREPLFPVAIDRNTVKRISTQDAKCFYPHRFLYGEIPLDKLCFLLQELCWGDLTQATRTGELQRQMEAWKALFDIREFKFHEVMGTSVLPSLKLESGAEDRAERRALQNIDCLAAICQLANNTPNASDPLPYERLKANRTLFNLSRLDVPCQGKTADDVKWVPAYRAYFGLSWLGDSSIECILNTGRDIGVTGLPDVDFILGPERFAGLLGRYRHLKGDEDREECIGDVGEDEVSIDEVEEVELDADDRTQWLRFFQWLGVNTSLRPIHFHDVEDRASGWLTTRNLLRPEGWAFHNIAPLRWDKYRQTVMDELKAKDAERFAATVPYFYELHDLEHLVTFSNIAVREATSRFAKVLYEHLARHWPTLEKFSQVVVAQVDTGEVPTRRAKPQQASGKELTNAGMNFWFFRLQEAAFCPTGHGPRHPSQTWLPTPEVKRRFERRSKPGSYLIPTLNVEEAVLRGKARAFAQALGVRDELGPATFTLADARGLLDRLADLYQKKCEAREDMRIDLRTMIRPAYRELLELLSGKADDGGIGSPLSSSMVLATDSQGMLRFLEAREVFYLDRRDTRERLVSKLPIWTFVIEAAPNAKNILKQILGMRVLEESLTWEPIPGDAALTSGAIEEFREGLRRLAPYLLARVGAERADERLARQDAHKLRAFIAAVEPVVSLDLSCKLDGHEITVSEESCEAFVEMGRDQVQAFVVWGENPWPPDLHESEILAGALCDVLGSGYFESFITLLQSESPALRERILRRAGAPVDLDDKRALFQALSEEDGRQEGTAECDVGGIEEPKTAAFLTGDHESPATGPDAACKDRDDAANRRRVPLYEPRDLLIEGFPIIITGEPAIDGKDRSNETASGGTRPEAGKGYGRFGGNTDLEKLDALGMWVALSFEQIRLRRGGLMNAKIFDAVNSEATSEVLVFNVSKPELVESARSRSNQFHAAMTWLHETFGIVPDWPGFDILTLDLRLPNSIGRMIELKSSGVASRVQGMTWNEWKTAKASTLREMFYLYLVGNLRSDLTAAQPYIRTIRNPFEQMVPDIQVARSIQKKVMLSVHEFHEAEHLDLTVHRTGSHPSVKMNA